MQAIGLCRFSYPALGGFQVEHESIEDRIAYLYAKTRLEERFRLFETVALPALRAQTDPDFTLIILIGDSFPTAQKQRLERLIQDIPQIVLHQAPPRNHREVMKELLNDARVSPAQPCLQFRYDDDDAIAVDFIAKLRQAARDCRPILRAHKSVAFDWNRGFVAEFGPDGISAVEMFRQFCVASLGMWVKGNCALTIMNFAHQKLPQFMPAVSFSDPHMWVHGHNGYNDSRQKPVKPIAVTPLSAKQETLFHDRFGINADHVRKVFSAA